MISPNPKRSLLFRSLVALAVLILVVVGGGYLAYRYTLHRMVSAYTEPAPLDLAEPDFSPEAFGELDGRLVNFAHSLRNKTPIPPLVLTSEELTALVVRSPEFRRLGGRAQFSIGEGEVQGQLSVPLDRLGYPDRWFNGSAAFGVTLENGVLIVTLRSASVKGNPIPDWLIEPLREQNLAKDLYEKPQNAALIARLESVSLGNGRITVVPRLQR